MDHLSLFPKIQTENPRKLLEFLPHLLAVGIIEYCFNEESFFNHEIAKLITMILFSFISSVAILALTIFLSNLHFLLDYSIASIFVILSLLGLGELTGLTSTNFDFANYFLCAAFLVFGASRILDYKRNHSSSLAADS